MGYSIEFEPCDVTNPIRVLHLEGERDRNTFIFKAFWSRPRQQRILGCRIECDKEILKLYWRHLYSYVRHPRCNKEGTVLTCSYNLVATRAFDIVSHFDAAGEHRELLSHNTQLKKLHIELMKSDVPAMKSMVGDMLQFATGFPPRP